MLALFGFNPDSDKFELFVKLALDDHFLRDKEELIKQINNLEKMNEIQKLTLKGALERTTESRLRMADGLRSLGKREMAIQMYQDVIPDPMATEEDVLLAVSRCKDVNIPSEIIEGLLKKAESMKNTSFLFLLGLEMCQ